MRNKGLPSTFFLHKFEAIRKKKYLSQIPSLTLIFDFRLCSRARRRDRAVTSDRGGGRHFGHAGAHHSRGGGARTPRTSVEAATRETGGAERAAAAAVSAAESSTNGGDRSGRYPE